MDRFIKKDLRLNKKPCEKMHTLIVGGTRGIGRVAVKTMAKNGNRVSVIGRHQHKEIDGSISKDQNITSWYGDIRDTEQINCVLGEIINRNGRIDNLLFFQRYRGDTDAWENEIDTTLTATKSVIEHLADGGFFNGESSIVIVSSVASDFIAQEQEVGYHVAKAGVLQLAKYYAVTLGKKKIRVNCVSPGMVLKEEAKPYYQKNVKKMELFERITPLGRMGTPEDIVNLIEFLCSPGASYITGQNIVIDGGLTLQMHASLCTEQFINGETVE